MIERGNFSRGLHLPKSTAKRNPIPKIHYITYHGGEPGRPEMVEKTAMATLPYVDTLTVVYNGEESALQERYQNRAKFGQDKLRLVSYSPRSGLIGDSIYLAILESGAIQGDWVIWHDSDERLTADTLPNLRKILMSVPRNYQEVLSTELLHNLDDKLSPVTQSKVTKRHIFRYSTQIIVQMDGGHCRILSGKSDKLPHAKIKFNHYKSDVSMAQSTFLHFLSSPHYHEWYSEYLAEWNAVKANLKHNYGVKDFSLMSLVRILKRPDLMGPIQNMLHGWKDADWNPARRMAAYGLDYYKSNLDYDTNCGGECCDYLNKTDIGL